jgi:hypothetical protein
MYVYNKTGHELKFDSFHILPFILIFKNVKVDNYILMQKVIIKLSPIRIFVNFFSPTNCISSISRINISRLEFKNSKIFNDGMKNKQYLFSTFYNFKIMIFIDEILMRSNFKILKVKDTNILINSHMITLDSIICFRGIPIKLNSQLKHLTNNIFTSSSSFSTVSDKIEILMKLNGRIDLSSFNITQSIVIEKLKYNEFQLKKSLGTFSKMGNVCDINLIGNFGQFKFNYNFDNVLRIKSKINVAKISKKMSGKVNVNFEKHNDYYTFRLNTLDLLVFGFDCRNLNVYGGSKKNYCGICNVMCTYGNTKKIEMDFLNNGDYGLRFFIKNKSIGTIIGNVKTKKINVNIKNVNVVDIPVIPSILRNKKGYVNISGKINDTAGHIDFKFNNYLGIIALRCENNAYLFNFYKNDNSVILNGVIKDCAIVSWNFKFRDFEISSILNASGYFKNKIFGISSGHIKYKKDFGIDFYIKIFNGKFFENKFSELKIKGDIDLNRINIEHFVCNSSDKILASATGMIGFTDENCLPSLYIDIKNINIGKVNLNGCIEFQGKFNKRDKKINGIIKSTCINVSGISLRNVCANLIILTNKFVDFKSDSEIKASLITNFKKNKICGYVHSKNIDIKGFNSNLLGFLNFDVKFFGKLSDLYVQAKFSIKKGRYLSQHFSLSSDLNYQSGSIKINKALFLADKTRIILKGNCLKQNHIFFTIDNLTEQFINSLIGFKIPVKGNFSGTIEQIVNNYERCFKIFLQAKNAYVKDIKLNDVKSNIKIVKDSIIIDNIFVKILNSEIKLDKGFFNVKNKKYGIDISLINIHFGVVDLFGNINLSGEMLKNEDNFMYRGIVSLNNLWINRWKLSCYNLDYIFKNKSLKIFNKSNDSDLYNFTGFVFFGDIISIKELNIYKDKSYFFLKADFSKKYIDLNAKSLNINWYFINSIFNLPDIAAEGNVNTNINLCGPIDNPKGDVSITSVEGSIMGVPYDNLDIVIDFFDNFASIKKINMFKKNGINIYVQGICPFWFDKTLSKKMRAKPINITYLVKDNKLNIFQYLFKDYAKPYGGNMFLRGSFTGTYENIKNNGKLSISCASFELKDHFCRVKDMSIEMLLIENLIKIDKFNFKSGGGELNACGQIKLDGFHVKNFDIKISTNKNGIFLCVPQLPMPNFIGFKFLFNKYSEGTPCFDIKIKGSPEENKVSGWILLENTRFTFPGTLLNACNKDSFVFKNMFANTEFDLELKSAKNTRFENSFISTLINGSVYMRGYHNNLKFSGIIEASNVKLNYFGLKFDILSAKIEIVDENQIYVTAEGETSIPMDGSNVNEFETVKLTIKRSKISNVSEKSIKFLFKNNPNVNSEKVLEKIIRAISINQSNMSKLDTSGFLVKQQALRFIDQSLTNPFIMKVLHKTKLIDNLRVSHVQKGFDVAMKDNSVLINLLLGTKYSLEKSITNRFFLGYSFVFDDFKNELDLRHEIKMRLKLTNNLYLNGSYEFESGNSHESDKRLTLNHQVCFGLN